jgi:hypothetical protein
MATASDIDSVAEIRQMIARASMMLNTTAEASPSDKTSAIYIPHKPHEALQKYIPPERLQQLKPDWELDRVVKYVYDS